MQATPSVLGTLRSLMRLLGFFNPKLDKPTTKLALTFWFYFVNIVLMSMSAQCIVELVLDGYRDIGQMCYVISMSGLETKQNTAVKRNFDLKSIPGVIFGASFQSIYMFFQKGRIIKLFELIDANFVHTSHTGFAEITMDVYLKKGMYVIYWWSCVLVFAVVFLVGSPLSVRNEKVLPLPTWYPYDWKRHPAFEWSFFTQTIALCLTDVFYLATEIIFPYVSLMTTGQFEILG